MKDKNGKQLRDGSRVLYSHACVGRIERGGRGTRMSTLNGYVAIRCLCGDAVFLPPTEVERV